MTNLHELRAKHVDGPVNIPDKLRELADSIEREGGVRTCLVVLDKRPGDGQQNSVAVECYGYRPFRHESLGLLEYAKMLLVSRG